MAFAHSIAYVVLKQDSRKRQQYS